MKILLTHYRNVFWLDNLESAQNPVLKPMSEIRSKYEQAGVGRGKQVVVYCRAGVQASHDYLTLKMLGYKPVVYDGSFFEWSNTEGMPVEAGERLDRHGRDWPVLRGEYLGQTQPGRTRSLRARNRMTSGR